MNTTTFECKLCSFTILIEQDKEIEETTIQSAGCKGQGLCFTSVPWSIPNKDTHFNFTGLFAGLCCICAHKKGWSPISFSDVGCFACKITHTRSNVFASEIKRSKDFWSNLDEDVIELIITFLTGRKQ